MNNLNSSTETNSAVLPLSYLPSIDQYCYMVQLGNIAFEIFETYPKQTCRNRTTILTANGLLRLTIPVIKTFGNRTRTLEVKIDNSTKWNKIHWKAINSAYNKSPFFLYYKDEIEILYNEPDELLIDFNIRLINQISKLIKIKPVINYTKEFLKEYKSIPDLRNSNKAIHYFDHQLENYTQVFSDRYSFEPNLSILDLLFNEGPNALKYLRNAQLKVHQVV